MSCTVGELYDWLGKLPPNATISEAHGRLIATSADRTIVLGDANVNLRAFNSGAPYRATRTAAQRFCELVNLDKWSPRDAYMDFRRHSECYYADADNRERIEFLDGSIAQPHWSDTTKATWDNAKWEAR